MPGRTTSQLMRDTIERFAPTLVDWIWPVDEAEEEGEDWSGEVWGSEEVNADHFGTVRYDFPTADEFVTKVIELAQRPGGRARVKIDDGPWQWVTGAELKRMLERTDGGTLTLDQAQAPTDTAGPGVTTKHSLLSPPRRLKLEPYPVPSDPPRIRIDWPVTAEAAIAIGKRWLEEYRERRQEPPPAGLLVDYKGVDGLRCLVDPRTGMHYGGTFPAQRPPAFEASDEACHREPAPESRQEDQMERPMSEEDAAHAIDRAVPLEVPGGFPAIELDAEVGDEEITELRFVVDGDGPEARFVELEEQRGRSVRFFEWVTDDPDYAPGLRYLRIPVRPRQSFNERQFVVQAQQIMTLQGDLGHLRLAIGNARPLLRSLLTIGRSGRGHSIHLRESDVDLLAALLEQPGGDLAPADTARIENGALRAETTRQRARIAELEAELRGAETARETAQATCDNRTEILRHRTEQVRELRSHVRTLVRHLDGDQPAWWLEAARAVFALEAMVELGESPADDGERP